jgi:hypothetical protein
MFDRYPIHDFIDDRLKGLGFWRGELVCRCGYKNISKGVRRLEQLCAGDIDSLTSRNLLKALPEALEVDQDAVNKAVNATAAKLAEEEAIRDAKWRASFQPDAYLQGTSTRPSQIFIFGITGGVERYLRIPLDLTQPASDFVRQALEVVRKTPVVPFFGPTTGFAINYTPDHAERYDVNGNFVEVLDGYYRPGTVRLFISGKEVPEGLFSR